MHFVFPFTPDDLACAESTLQWVAELGGAKGHHIILMPARKVTNYDRLKELAAKSFDTVEILPDCEAIEGHPTGPNSMMRQAIWHCQTASIGPWMFWEPDCVPRCSGFADTWEREYKSYGKPFMGEFRPASGVTPDYLTGNMVLPKGALLLAPMLARRGLSRDGVELAFDIVAASQTLPQAHLTKLLQQVPKNSDGSSHHFPNQESLSLLREGAVFFHPCKDGSLIDRLRKNGACVSGLNVSFDPGHSGEQEPGAVAKAPHDRPGGSNPSAPSDDKTELDTLRAEVATLRNDVDRLLRENNGFRTGKIKPTRTPEEQNKVDERMAKVRAGKQKVVA